ncbi:GNAT family N-acetyltransferase [Paraglaciecola aestuariivivens]
MYQKSFVQLTKNELYALLLLRQQVFIIEQQSIYPDLDELDQVAMHVLENDEAGQLLTYARYRLDELANKVKIERVVLHPSQRGKGKGKALINYILAQIKQQYPEHLVELSSQLEASEFYQHFGFVCQGQPYDDGGVMHIDMHLLAAPKAK